MAVVMCLDPGQKNFAFAILKNMKTSVKLLHCGMIKDRVTDLKGDIDLYEQVEAYKSEMTNLLLKYEVSSIIVERFMMRGIMASAGETVGIMIGILASLAHEWNIPFRCVGAMTWKRAVKHDCKLTLKDYLKVGRQKANVKVKDSLDAVHRIDAVFIGLWICGKHNYIDRKSGPAFLKGIILCQPQTLRLSARRRI